MSAADEDLMLHAFLDGELDVAGVIDMQRRLTQDQELAARYARLKAVREAMRGAVSREAAPESLRARVMADAARAAQDFDSARGPAPGATQARDNGARRLRLLRLQPLASLMAASLVIAAGIGFYVGAPRYANESETMKALVAAHMRGQISGRPVDVASSDRHTVKPWLAAKLPASVTVVDLAGDGFPLIGARIDILNGAAEPTLVYKRREHLISLTQVPAAAHGAPETPKRTQAGYPVESWSDGARDYFAISDLSPAELEAFAEMFRAAAARESGGLGKPPT